MSGGPDEYAAERQEQDMANEAEEPVFEAEADVEDESGEVMGAAGLDAAAAAAAAAAASAYTSPTPRRAPLRVPPRRSNNSGIKATAAPVLLTVGILVLIPAVWSVLHLSGIARSSKDDADGMAMFMLVCWPIALALIAAGVVFMMQAMRDKKR